MQDRSRFFTPVLIAGCAIILVCFGIRSTFGLFQIPIEQEFGWLRTEFSLAIAIQNLAWGIGQPIFGAIAEKIGDRLAVAIGAILYALGLLLSAGATTPLEHQMYEWLVGFGIAGTGFGVLLAAVGRAATDENRSMSMAVLTVVGSVGQIVGPPLAEWLLSQMNWQEVFLVFAAAMLATLLFVIFLRVPVRANTQELEESLTRVLGRAFTDPSYILIFLGFFSCGYQLGFITAHFPAFVTEVCGAILPGGLLHGLGITTTSALGAFAISVIGAANIAGTLTAGWAGKRFPKKYVLSVLYTIRAIIGVIFIAFPMTPLTVLIFSVVMGGTWLATVPLTSGLVAQIYGLRYMGTLYGFVFLSHQIGSFLGVWLGGRLYDVYGSYDLVWWIGVGVGAFSAIVHLPVKERPLAPAPA